MAVAFRSKSEVEGSGSNPTPTEPAGTIQGDVLYALFYSGSAGGAPSLPTGWTQLDTGTNASFDWKIGRVVRGASAPSFAFTMSNPPGFRGVVVVCVSGADTTTPESASTYGTSASVANIDPPAVTPAHNDCIIIAGGTNWNGAPGGGYSTPANYTMRTANASGTGFAIVTRVLSGGSGSSENPAAITGATAAQTHAFSIAVRPLAAAASLVVPLRPERGLLMRGRR